MKSFFAVLCSFALLVCMVFTGCSEKEPEIIVPEELKILCIGNSFSADTLEHMADIALSVGVQSVKMVNLYIGGSSINKHYQNAQKDLAVYDCYINTGNGWTSTSNHKISTTIQSENWDWISIQHGTADGSRYAEVESYQNLPALVEIIRGLADDDTKIAFNMTWVGDRNSHEEMISSYGNNQLRYYKDVAALTRDTIVPIEHLDCVAPTGTGIQNLRTSDAKPVTRDKYHLSKDIGCYTAGLTFFKALTGLDISDIEWAPDGVSEYAKQAAIEAANNAVQTPYEVTETVLDSNDFTKNTTQAE